MNRIQLSFRTALLVAGVTATGAAHSRADYAPRAIPPDAVVDLCTPEGAARVRGQWHYSDTRINEIEHRSVGLDLKASGPPNRTYDFTPDGRGADFDDSK